MWLNDLVNTGSICIQMLNTLATKVSHTGLSPRMAWVEEVVNIEPPILHGNKGNTIPIACAGGHHDLSN